MDDKYESHYHIVKVTTDGRIERRLAAMRRVQAAALDLFEARGFEAVTVEAIARSAGVGPATVYRNFETKERLVLWDEYDPALLQEIESRLPSVAPLDAVLAAVTASVGRVFARDKQRILRRTRLMLAVPELLRAARDDRVALTRALAQLFARTGSFGDALQQDVAADAIAGALEVAVTRWARGGGRRSLEHVLRRTFEALASLGGARAP